MQHSKKPTLSVIALICLFFGPMLVAYWFYATGYTPERTTSNGTLLTPPLSFSDLSIEVIDPQSPILTTLNQKWVLLYLGRDACDAACRQSLYHLRQIHIATGKHQDRVSELYLTEHALEDRAVKDYIQQEHAHLVRGVVSNLQSLTSGSIYIVDPLGNIMLQFDESAPPKGVLNDLKKLLKYSKIG